MNHKLLTLSLGALLLASCVTPSASVTDLTKKNIQTAEDLRVAQEASLAQFGHLLDQLEKADLELYEELRRKVDRLAVEAMRDREDLLRERMIAHFESGLQHICGEQFEQRATSEFKAPYKRVLDEDSRSLSELSSLANKFPDDVRAKNDFHLARQLHDYLKIQFAEKTIKLYLERDQRRETVRSSFLRKLNARTASHRARVESQSTTAKRSLTSILTEVEVEEAEQEPDFFRRTSRCARPVAY